MARKKHAYDYYDTFVTLVGYSCDAAAIVDRTLRSFDPEAVAENMDALHEIEHAADNTKHEMTEVLIREFLPPIEREDITVLAERIDDVTDALEDVIVKIYTFNIRAIRSEALAFMDIIIDCCSMMKKAVEEFRNFKKSSELMRYIIEINRLEGDGDQLYTRAMRDLHVNSSDPVEIITWSKTFDYLENCCDACEDVANAIESIVMKNS